MNNTNSPADDPATTPNPDPSDFSHLERMMDEHGRELDALMNEHSPASKDDNTATDLQERTAEAVAAIAAEDERTRAWRSFLAVDNMSVWMELRIRLTSARVAAETVCSADQISVDRAEAASAARTAFDDLTCLVEIIEHDAELEIATLEERLYRAQHGTAATDTEEG